MPDATLANQLYVGLTDEGEKFYLTVTLRELASVAPHQTIEHEAIDGYIELSMTGDLVRKGGSIKRDCDVIAGQNIDDLRRVVVPHAPLRKADIDVLAGVWDRWHLNGMRAGCAHQTVVWEEHQYGRRPSLDLTLPCPVSDYRYGHAWLVEVIPEPVLDNLRSILGAGVTV